MQKKMEKSHSCQKPISLIYTGRREGKGERCEQGRNLFPIKGAERGGRKSHAFPYIHRCTCAQWKEQKGEDFFPALQGKKTKLLILLPPHCNSSVCPDGLFLHFLLSCMRSKKKNFSGSEKFWPRLYDVGTIAGKKNAGGGEGEVCATNFEQRLPWNM